MFFQNSQLRVPEGSLDSLRAAHHRKSCLSMVFGFIHLVCQWVYFVRAVGTDEFRGERTVPAAFSCQLCWALMGGLFTRLLVRKLDAEDLGPFFNPPRTARCLSRYALADWIRPFIGIEFALSIVNLVIASTLRVGRRDSAIMGVCLGLQILMFINETGIRAGLKEMAQIIQTSNPPQPAEQGRAPVDPYRATAPNEVQGYPAPAGVPGYPVPPIVGYTSQQPTYRAVAPVGPSGYAQPYPPPGPSDTAAFHSFPSVSAPQSQQFTYAPAPAPAPAAAPGYAPQPAYYYPPAAAGSSGTPGYSWAVPGAGAPAGSERLGYTYGADYPSGYAATRMVPAQSTNPPPSGLEKELPPSYSEATFNR